METSKLNLLGWGFVEVEIIWIEDKLLKLRFIHMKTLHTEVFHFNEILNYSEIFIDKHLKIHKYDITK